MRLIFLFLMCACVSVGVKRMPAAEPELNFGSFLELIKNKQVSSVSEAVVALRTQYERHLKFRTAIYRSESIQQASFKEPRILVFGRSARFVFTFNGGPHQYGGDAIEAYQFDESSKSFNFYSIIFKTGMRDLIFNDSDIAFQNDRIIVSKASPSLCLGCHGTPAIPIWQDDLNWPGLYGSNDDLLYGSFNRRNYIKHGQYAYLEGLQYPRSQGRWIDIPREGKDRELDGYLQYLKNSSENERYRQLPRQVFEAGFLKYIAGERDLDDSSIIEKESAELRPDESSDRPNLYFTEKVTHLAAEVLISEIERHPNLVSLLKRVLSDLAADQTYYYPGGRRGIFSAAEKIQGRIRPEIRNLLDQASGNYRKHFDDTMRDELEMQVVKLQSIEADLGTNLVVPPGWPAGKWLDTEVSSGYQKLLGRPLNRLETIAVQGEAADLPVIALLSYILKSEAIDLKNYSTNSQVYPTKGRERVSSFPSSDLKYIISHFIAN